MLATCLLKLTMYYVILDFVIFPLVFNFNMSLIPRHDLWFLFLYISEEHLTHQQQQQYME